MKYTALSVILVLITPDKSNGMEPKICKIPNGDAGNCVALEQCPPLSAITNNTEHRSRDEATFLRQSVASCGSQGRLLKVCCPPESLWPSFVAKPVIYPDILNYVKEDNDNNSSADTSHIGSEMPLTNRPETGAIVNSITSESIDACGVDANLQENVIGGQITEIYSYPWLALLEYAPEQLLCAGSLITNRFVLTAASCVSGVSGKPRNVRLSEYNISSYPSDTVPVDGGGEEVITVKLVGVEWAQSHPEHDIALVMLNESVQFSDVIRPICLPTRDLAAEFANGTDFTVAGWGGDDGGAKSEVKRDASVKLMPNDSCKAAATYDGLICAGDSPISCRGDPGGPLMYIDNGAVVIVGVKSEENGACGASSVYVDVYRHLDWIETTVNA